MRGPQYTEKQYHGDVTSHFSLFLTFRLADWLECSFTHSFSNPQFTNLMIKKHREGTHKHLTSLQTQVCQLILIQLPIFFVSVQSSEPSNLKSVCFSSWIIWIFTKRPCCQSSSAPSLSEQNYNCCVTRQWSLSRKLMYRIWHLLVAEGFTSFKARQVRME